MKKFLMLLAMLMMVSSLVLAEEVAMDAEAAEAVAEEVVANDDVRNVTATGNVEFETSLFSNKVTNSGAKDALDVSEGGLINTGTGDQELKAEISGTWKTFNWKTTFDVDDDGDFADKEDVTAEISKTLGDLTLTIGKSMDLNLTEVTSWSNGTWVKAMKKIGKVEVQAKGEVSGGKAVEAIDGDTYIKYNFTDLINATFKPYEVEFKVGGEFETEVDKKPGVEYSVGLSEMITIDGALGMSSTSNKNKGEVDGQVSSDMDLNKKVQATIKLSEMITVTPGILLNLTSGKETGSKDLKEATMSGTPIFTTKMVQDTNADGTPKVDGDGNPVMVAEVELTDVENNIVANLKANVKVSDAISVEAEGNFSTGKFKTTYDGKDQGELSKSAMGIYAKLTADVQVVEVYGKLKMDQSGTKLIDYDADGKESEEATVTGSKTELTIGAGASKKLNDVSLGVDFELIPVTEKSKMGKADEVAKKTTETKLTFKAAYSF